MISLNGTSVAVSDADMSDERGMPAAMPSLMIIFRDQDGAVTDVKTDHALGIAGQIGFNYMINQNWGVVVDLKKVYLRARTSGNLGAAPIKATVTLDPLVLHTGVTYRF